MLCCPAALLQVRFSAQAAVNFGLEVFAKFFGDDAGGSEFAEVGDGEFGEIGQDGGESGVGMADEGQADVVDAGPFAMENNGMDYVGREFLAGEYLQDL